MIHGPEEAAIEDSTHKQASDRPELVWRRQSQADLTWPLSDDDAGRPEPSWWPPGAWRTEPR